MNYDADQLLTVGILPFVVGFVIGFVVGLMIGFVLGRIERRASRYEPMLPYQEAMEAAYKRATGKDWPRGRLAVDISHERRR